MWEVRYHPEADGEFGKLPATEQAAMQHAVRKLEAIGPRLPFPHSSAVQQGDGLRELRPRRGKSPWRGIYGQIGRVFIIVAVCPEAKNNHRGFSRGCEAAERRLAEMEE